MDSPVSNTTLNPKVWEDILQQEERELLLKLPASLMLGLMMVLGVPGNILVIIVYRLKMKHSAYRVFVLCMAAFDLVNCLVGIPFELADLGNDVTFKNAGVCKTFRFVITFCACGSVSILMAVSWERFRRVCRPLGFQISVKQSWVLSGVCGLIALVFAVPALVFYGVKTELRHGYRLYDCSIDDYWGNSSAAVFIYQILLGIVWFLCIFILAGVYIFIIYTIKKQNQRRRNNSGCSPLPGQPLVNFTLPGAELSTSCQTGPFGDSKTIQYADMNSLESELPALNKGTPFNSTGLNAQTTSRNGQSVVGRQAEKTCEVESGSNGILQSGDPDGNSTTTAVHRGNNKIKAINRDVESERGIDDATLFVRLFSRDVNPLQHSQSPAQQHRSGEFKHPPTVWEDDDQIQHFDGDEHLGIDTLGRSQSPQCERLQQFTRQESMNNYYSSTAQTPEGSQDSFSQCDPDDVGGLSCKKSAYAFRSWEAFNPSEGGGSFQTLNKSGSSEAIKPLAGNLRKHSETRGFEVSVAAVELHYGGTANGEENTSMLSASKSCSVLDSVDVSRRSSNSRAAQWGSLNVLNSVSFCLGDDKDLGAYISNSSASGNIDQADLKLHSSRLAWETKINFDIAKEYRRRKLGHCGMSSRLCVSDDIVLNENNVNHCCFCAANTSLPFLTEELRQEELGHFSMRRTMSVPSLPSLTDITPCGHQRRKKLVIKDLKGTSEKTSSMQWLDNGPTPDKNANNVAEIMGDIGQDPPNNMSPDGSKKGEKPPNLLEIATQKTKLSMDTTAVPSNLSRRRTTSSGTGREVLTTKLTYTMVAVTVGFILSYLPHLIVQIGRGLDADGVRTLLQSCQPFFVMYHLFVRSFFINNAINPIIYGFWNETFRKKSSNLLKSWVGPALAEGRCGEKVCPTRFRVWALRDLGLSSSHIEETG